RSSSKGKIGKAWTTSRALRRKTFRVEHVRFLPKCRVTGGTIGTEKDHTVGWKKIPTNVIRGDGKTSEAECWGIETHRCLDHHARVGQAIEVFSGWQSPCEHGVQFGVPAALNLRMLRKQVPRPGESCCRRFIPCQQQGQHFIAHLS